MSSAALAEDGQALVCPSSSSQENNVSSHSDSSDDELEVVLGPSALPDQASVNTNPVSVNVTNVSTVQSTVQPTVNNVQPTANPAAVGSPSVNVRYTTVPLLPMIVDPTSVHVGTWYTVVAGRFIGVFEDTGAADRATHKVSCSSHKAHSSQQAAVNAFNVAQSVGDLEVIMY